MGYTGRTPGRAQSVQRLSDPVEISLAGDANGSISIDGSQDVELSVVVADDSHNHIISNVDGLQDALDLKAPLTSPTFTGYPSLDSADQYPSFKIRSSHASGYSILKFADVNNSGYDISLDSVNDNIAVNKMVDGSYDSTVLILNDSTFQYNYNDVWHEGNFTPSDYATLASPTFTGTPTAPTAPAGTNTSQVATTSFVSTAVANLANSAPETLDTLNELAAALGDDPNFATTVVNSIGTKQDASTALTTSTSFGGDVSGTYDTIVVADDSHNHVISNVDGLQDVLDEKVDKVASTDNSVPTFDGITGAIQNKNAMFIDDSGNVGIGTDTPSVALHMHTASPMIRLTSTILNPVEGGAIELCETNDHGIGLRYDGVDNIGILYGRQSSVNTEILRFHRSGGTVTFNGAIQNSKQPAFQVGLGLTAFPGGEVAGTATIFGDTVGTYTLDSPHFDRGGNINTSNGRFTAPVTGVYVFAINVGIANGDTTDQNNNLNLFVNGASKHDMEMEIEANVVNPIIYNMIVNVELTQGDYVNIGTVNLATGNDFTLLELKWCGHLIG